MPDPIYIAVWDDPAGSLGPWSQEGRRITVPKSHADYRAFIGKVVPGPFAPLADRYETVVATYLARRSMGRCQVMEDGHGIRVVGLSWFARARLRLGCYALQGDWREWGRSLELTAIVAVAPGARGHLRARRLAAAR